ncbi:MAG: carnitine dehydratase [Crocinitomicaceae bacterium]|nr:carnitine dehydratase [Crocinitomicaceae bacterium]|tara:strand:+ start:5398 stop:6462 length:1065 start_codon:yes stop_codon:yes gene_type:complete
MLKKIKVLDLSTVLAGPSVATYFAELGAEVTKIEHPENKDITRKWKLPIEDKNINVSAYFSSVNYKKKYINLNLKKSSDYTKFIELIKTADILITNFKYGDDIKLNIEDKTLHKINPSLIIGKINGFGSDSDRVAYDLILQAETGFMSINGTLESGPIKMPVAMIDILAAHHLKEALLISLLNRNETGKGSSVSVSLYDVAISSLTNQSSNYLMTKNIPNRIGSIHPNIAPYGELFTTKDGNIITLAIGSNQHFKKLCSILNCEELCIDNRFQTNQNRVENRIILKNILEKKIQNKNSLNLLSKLRNLKVPAGEIKNIEEVLTTPQAKKLIKEEIIEGVKTYRTTSVVFNSKET